MAVSREREVSHPFPRGLPVFHGPRFVLAFAVLDSRTPFHSYVRGLLPREMEPVVFRVTDPKGAHSGVYIHLRSYYLDPARL